MARCVDGFHSFSAYAKSDFIPNRYNFKGLRGLDFIPKQYIYGVMTASKKMLCATCATSDPALAAICVLPSRLCEFKRRNGNGTKEQISGADAQDSKTTNRAISPKQQEKKVKTAIVAMILATAIIGPASAGGFKIEKPCWNKCAEPAPVAAPPLFWPMRPKLGWRPGTEQTPTYVSVWEYQSAAGAITGQSIYRSWDRYR